MPRDLSADGGDARDVNRDLPVSLTLTFSKAADYSAINELFTPENRKKIDPHNFVAERHPDDFKAAIAYGGAGFLEDENGKVRIVTIAYRTHVKHKPEPRGHHDYTEFGSALSDIPGYNSAQLIMASLALKEWWMAMPRKKIINEIDNRNGPSVKTYRDYLKWEKIENQTEIDTLFDACYQNTVTDYGNGPGNPPTPDKRIHENFYALSNAAIAVHAQILLQFLNQGGLINKRTQHHIPVDFSALDTVGLTRPFLEAVAGGETDRKKLAPLSRRTGPAP